MADTNDTIDGLLAEFRGYAAGMPPSYHVTMSWHDFNRMIDRFDAAHKREVDKLNSAIQATVSHSDAEIDRLRREIAEPRRAGSAAKLREALETLRELLGDLLRLGDAEYHNDFSNFCDIIDAALSTPPRNCDLPEVAKDPWRAWLDDKSNWDEDGNPELEIHDWLLAPATEKEGGAK